WERTLGSSPGAILPFPHQKPAGVLGIKLLPQHFPKRIGSIATQIIVEIPTDRDEQNHLDPETQSSNEETISYTFPNQITITKNIKPPKHEQEQDNNKIHHQKRHQHQHVEQNLTNQQ